MKKLVVILALALAVPARAENKVGPWTDSFKAEVRDFIALQLRKRHGSPKAALSIAQCMVDKAEREVDQKTMDDIFNGPGTSDGGMGERHLRECLMGEGVESAPKAPKSGTDT